MQQRTILVVDDDARVRRGLKSLIESSMDLGVVGEASSVTETLAFDVTFNPDVVVLDLRLPASTDGMDVLAVLVGRGRTVIAISVQESLRFDALAAGAFAFLEKGGQGIDHLLDMIRVALPCAGPNFASED
jgi:DNA-binding NarL/FixJ family response regulator